MNETEAGEAAALLRRLLVLLPDAGGRDTALRQRVEGAAVALDSVAGGSSDT